MACSIGVVMTGVPYSEGMQFGREAGVVVLERAPLPGKPGRRLSFQRPERVLEARSRDEVGPALRAIDEALAAGLYVAGYVGYEAGLALELSLADLEIASPAEEPLLWLGCYRECEITEGTQWSSVAGPHRATSELAPLLSLNDAEYAGKVMAVHEWIAAGETYQANLTMEARWQTEETAEEMYARLLRAQPVEHAALLTPCEGWHVLSFSPELFFRREGDRLVTRPMKGTAAPGMDIAETRAQAAWLAADEKNRAENVMIVDLLRNDLGRICRVGSVEVTGLLQVERYPSVLQMTSTIEGLLCEGAGYAEIFAALFPSGSIVGAPKVHTMRRLHALEGRPRGVYTGAIGYMAPDGHAEFNVAIRTVTLRDGEARMGVGSGIVADSITEAEYRECQTKMEFLTSSVAGEFSLIETLLLKNGAYVLLEEHLQRMEESADYFGIPFDAGHVREALEQVRCEQDHAENARVRLLLDDQGRPTCTASPAPANGEAPVDLLLWPERTRSQDRFLRHKTTRRAHYDEALLAAQAKGYADALFENERGEITEGAIHNVIAVLDGQWITPPLSSGVLPGVYRRKLLEEGRLVESVLRWSDLERAEAIYFCNSVRGLRRVAGVRGHTTAIRCPR